MALTGYGEESYGFCSVLRRGCAEGRSPFAGVWGCHTDFEIPLESSFAKVGTDKEVQQNAAGVWGVPRSLFPPRMGDQGG
jgi:hypothetical protein